MENKTCGECKYYNDAMFHCEKFDCMAEDGWFCPDCEEKEKPKPTNGDKIMQGGNRALAEFHGKLACDVCAYRYDHRCIAPQGKPLTCADGIEAWLNAPAEIEEREE